jgi:hypothetical protein
MSGMSTPKRVIQEAMSVTGLAAGDLAFEGARRLLDEHQRMVLSGADRDVFLAAIGRDARSCPVPCRCFEAPSSTVRMILRDQGNRSTRQA